MRAALIYFISLSMFQALILFPISAFKLPYSRQRSLNQQLYYYARFSVFGLPSSRFHFFFEMLLLLLDIERLYSFPPL